MQPTATTPHALPKTQDNFKIRSISRFTGFGVVGEASLQLEIAILWWFAWRIAIALLYHMGHYTRNRWMCWTNQDSESQPAKCGPINSFPSFPSKLCDEVEWRSMLWWGNSTYQLVINGGVMLFQGPLAIQPCGVGNWIDDNINKISWVGLCSIFIWEASLLLKWIKHPSEKWLCSMLSWLPKLKEFVLKLSKSLHLGKERYYSWTMLSWIKIVWCQQQLPFRVWCLGICIGFQWPTQVFW